MKKIKFRLLKRSVIIFACLMAVFGSSLISISFKRSYMAEQSHVFNALSACASGIQSAYAAFVLRGADADLSTLNEIARQYDLSAKISETDFEKSAVSYVREGTLHAETDLHLGNALYRLSVSNPLSDIYQMRSIMTYIYKAAYLIFLPLTAIIMYISGRTISKPIETLTHTARLHTGGNRDARAKINTNDEIETLSNAFNQMADQVESEIRRREELIGDLTHEMKTPLQAIIGETDLMLLGKRTDEEKFGSLETIHHQAQRLDRLSKRMMEWINLKDNESARITACALNRILENTQNLFSTKHPIIIEETDALVYADGLLMETLLSNLIDNAINAEAKTIRLFVEKENGFVVLSVQDDGCGMDEETLLHIEEPFFRADKARSRAHGGAGLGVSLAARIARLHDTRLTYESEKGKGTRVRITLKEAQND